MNQQEARVVPYVDAVLCGDRLAYFGFLKRLCGSKLLVPRQARKARVTPFFAAKKLELQPSDSHFIFPE